MIKHSSYNGLDEKAAPGTHQKAWEVLEEKKLNKNVKIIDLAAGNGAFASRFHQAGYRDITLSELVSKEYPFSTKAIYSWDLNMEFSKLSEEHFDVVTAIEIIEHLDSPLHFLREIRQIMTDNGILLITTPNVQNIMSRLKFLFKGELKSFGYQDFLDQRHIHGITDHQIKIFFNIVGFDLLAQTSAGSFYSRSKKLLLGPLYWASHLLGGYLARGDVNIYLLQKAASKLHHEDSKSHYSNLAADRI